MGWIPDWAAKSYAKLYVEFQDQSFDFSSGLDVLGITDQEFSRVIQELQTEGFLYRGRKAIDRRKRQYRLVSPEHAVYALALGFNQNASVDEKLRAAQGHFNYLITGGSAASRYHNYVISSKTDIRVFRKDLGFWIAHLTEPGVQISVDGQVSEKGNIAVEITTDLTQASVARANDQDGVDLESREDLIGSLLREPADDNVMDALALMIAAREVLDWDRLAKSDMRQEIGFLMDAGNSAAAGQVFSEDLVNQFRGGYSLQKRFGMGTPDTGFNQSYVELADQWGLELALHGRVIKKVIDDLVP
jgi:hypothetical protein